MNKEQRKKKVTEIKTYTVPYALEKSQENITIANDNTTQASKEKLITQAIELHLKGNIKEAVKYYQYFIDHGIDDHRIFSNYGIILRNNGQLKEAEIATRKALKLNPVFIEAYLNLGNILKDNGQLKEAEIATRKTIELDPNNATAYYNLGNILSDLGKLKDAEIATRKAIMLNPDYSMAHYNLGGILIAFDKLKEAEIATQKAIKLNPKFSQAHYNLGSVLSNLGRLKEAEISFRKAIDITPNLAKAYYSLSTLNYSEDNKIWLENLFSERILNNKSKQDKVDIYFARSNVLHKERNYTESSLYLQLANNLKLDFKPSNCDVLINKSKRLLIESDQLEINYKQYSQTPESIFIVGMPRSGSTLLESILSKNINLNALGEINILEESFLEWKKNDIELNLAELYWLKTNNHKNELTISTNKWLYNYQYVGIISRQIPNAKIIHCFRNPLDNILSIFRAHFSTGIEYSSSLVDCAKIYLDQKKIMDEYKNKFRSKIYDLNYDLLVRNNSKEIKSLINWLGWEWDDAYLSPHLNPRSVSTASNVQVRSPINSKSIDGWKNYKEMLQPAIKSLLKEIKIAT